jgi:hypothetical protein
VDGLKTGMLTGALALVVAAAGAQPAATAATPGQRAQQIQARFQIGAMEGVLERAVQMGAQKLRMQVQAVAPDLLFIAGAPRARGFWLDGYGVFFDVEVPVLRRSVAWTLRTMVDDNGMAATTAIQEFKSHLETIQDPRVKATLQQALKRIELQVGPVQAPNVSPAPRNAVAPQRGTVTALDVDPPVPPPAPPSPKLTAEDEALLANPSEVYEKEVIGALIDAMLDYSAPIAVGPDEWLTVAARDNEHRDRLMPGDAYDLMTIVLRVKGSDLAAFRADRITREDARKRVEVREF